MTYDLVLSSGFLAFARHAGFLAAVEEVGLPVGGLCGTSSGALVGALWAAGVPAKEILAELAARRPIAWARPHLAVWRGAFRMDAIVEELAGRVPDSFSGLPRPFGVGVTTPEGGHALLTDGPLAQAVAASCAVPYLFVPIEIGGRVLSDGGAVDRLGLDAWRAHRPGAAIVVHNVDRTAGATGGADLSGLPVVTSPRSGASLWSLGDVWAAYEESRALALPQLAPLVR